MGPDPSFSAIYWPPHKLVEMGFNQDTLALANSVSTRQFAEEHTGALEAWVQSWNEGMQWVVEQTPADLVTGEEVIQPLAAQTREEAEFILDWAFNFFETPVAPVNIELTDEEIDSEMRGVQKAEELGFVPSGGEDRLTYAKIPQT